MKNLQKKQLEAFEEAKKKKIKKIIIITNEINYY